MAAKSLESRLNRLTSKKALRLTPEDIERKRRSDEIDAEIEASIAKERKNAKA
jgi:hypothetical protein